MKDQYHTVPLKTLVSLIKYDVVISLWNINLEPLDLNAKRILFLLDSSRFCRNAVHHAVENHHRDIVLFPLDFISLWRMDSPCSSLLFFFKGYIKKDEISCPNLNY